MVRGILGNSFGAHFCAIPKNVTRWAIALVTLVLGTTSVVGVPDDERYLSFYNIHTKEKLSVVYKRNGKYIPDAMKKLNHIMRDWRRDEPTKMDPKLIDLVWELHTQLGSQKPIHLISGYRSRKTNERLRRKGGGQARNSRHIMGKAADIHFPDVSAKQLRNSALVKERGGVGYYPTSAIPFVHVDTQGVRHWPRLPRLELASLFPNGKTRHRPRKGGPITKRDYRKAMAKLSDKQKRLIRIARGEIKPDRPAPATYQVASATPVETKPAPPQVARVVTPIQPKVAKPVAAKFQVASLSPTQPLWQRQQPSQQQLSAPLPTPAPNPPLLPLVTASFGVQAANAAAAPMDINPRPGLSPSTQDKSSPGVSIPLTPPAGQLIEREQSRLILASADPVADLINNFSGKPAAVASPGQNWARAPSFDDEHDDELAYQPFPILPLMGKLTDASGAYFEKMTPPEQANVMALLGEKDVLPMHFRQGLPFAQMLWSNEFKGLAIATLALGKGSSHPKTKQYMAANQ